ncbi:hypothetical protein BDM02DRAFT_3118709 [Thelephora ganbajun]|uniref:Uncharacterized protein n=1 Tax=Thelephora ganbajun TaxID=370292 RepID=A0ACB6Z9T0_THEGA|nr:hypothetical protein BDM02DRAFT_3118709 [Thelephora ganbajun]
MRMKILSLSTVLCLTAIVATAPIPHGPLLRVSFPGVRGNRPASNVGQPCNGYANATNNRQIFPIADGHILWHGSSTNWSAAVTIAFGGNPNTTDSFTNGTTDQFVVPWSTGTTTSGCIPVNISALLSPEIRIGGNATLQLVQDTGGKCLSQCMDVRMGRGTSLPKGVKCTTPLSGNGGWGKGKGSILSVRSQFILVIVILVLFIIGREVTWRC